MEVISEQRRKELLKILPYLIGECHNLHCAGGIAYQFSLKSNIAYKDWAILKECEVVSFVKEAPSRHGTMKLHSVDRIRAEQLLQILIEEGPTETKSPETEAVKFPQILQDAYNIGAEIYKAKGLVKKEHPVRKQLDRIERQFSGLLGVLIKETTISELSEYHRKVNEHCARSSTGG